MDPLFASRTEYVQVLGVLGTVFESIVERVRILCAFAMVLGFQAGVEVAGVPGGGAVLKLRTRRTRWGRDRRYSRCGRGRISR